tara:strand:- start:200 stop:640 length:441 start_codon:yes stop_codon:yes gene_type:complete
MSHVRQQIREAFKSVLDTALPNHTVFSARRYAINAASLPTVDMKFLNENSEFTTMSDRQDRTASLYIRATHQASDDDIDDVLDDVAVLIEEAIAAEGRFNGLLIDIGLMQTNFTDSADGDKALAEVVLRYDVVYRTFVTDVENAER